MRTLPAVLLATILVGLPAAAPAAATPKNARQLVNLLKTRRLSVEFKGTSLKNVLQYLRLATGANIVLDKQAITKDGGDPDAVEITLVVNNVTAADVMKLAIEPLGFGLLVKGNVLLITSKRKARGKLVLVHYNVADVLFPLRDFPAADINIYPSNYEPPEAPEPQEHVAVESSEELAELVRQFTGRETWEDEGVRIHTFRKALFVRQYASVHREIKVFLSAVRGLR